MPLFVGEGRMVRRRGAVTKALIEAIAEGRAVFCAMRDHPGPNATPMW